jgi:hypothetical protein
VRRDVIGVFNFDLTATMTQSYPLAKLGLLPAAQYVGFDFWANTFVMPFSGTFDFSIVPTASRIVAVRPVSGKPMVISTSRHVSQGIYDIVEEKWDASTKTLSGTSHVVAGDPYERRIWAANADGGSWTAASAAVSTADQTAGVTVMPPSQKGNELRVTLQPKTDRDVSWSVVFQ